MPTPQKSCTWTHNLLTLTCRKDICLEIKKKNPEAIKTQCVSNLLWYKYRPLLYFWKPTNCAEVMECLFFSENEVCLLSQLPPRVEWSCRSFFYRRSEWPAGQHRWPPSKNMSLTQNCWSGQPWVNISSQLGGLTQRDSGQEIAEWVLEAKMHVCSWLQSPSL